MLFEKLSYQDDFPINITIASIEEYPIHFHQDIEFLYVLKGKIDLKNGYCVYTLHEGDIFVNAGHEVHSMQSVDDEENIVALIQISTRYFSQYFPNLGKACYRTYSKKAPIQGLTLCGKCFCRSYSSTISGVLITKMNASAS